MLKTKVLFAYDVTDYLPTYRNVMSALRLHLVDIKALRKFAKDNNITNDPNGVTHSKGKTRILFAVDMIGMDLKVFTRYKMHPTDFGVSLIVQFLWVAIHFDFHVIDVRRREEYEFHRQVFQNRARQNGQ